MNQASNHTSKPPRLGSSDLDGNPVQPSVVRNIVLRFTEKQVGADNIESIVNWYNNGIELGSILKKINASSTAIANLGLCDLYTILMIKLKAGAIKQRKQFLIFELTIQQFSILYNCWRQGMTHKNILRETEGSRLGKERALKSIAIRHNQEQHAIQLKEDVTAKSILQMGVAGVHCNRQALIIYLDEIPRESLELFGIHELDDSEVGPILDSTAAPQAAASQPSPTGIQLSSDPAERRLQELAIQQSGSAFSTGKNSQIGNANPGEISPLPPSPVNPHGVMKRGDVTADGKNARISDRKFTNDLEKELVGDADPEVVAEAERLAAEEYAQSHGGDTGKIADLFG